MNPKPHYPAHVFHQLVKYPRLTCEECGGPIMPRLHGPDKSSRRTYLETITNFRRKKYCGKACASIARGRERSRLAKERAAKRAAKPPKPRTPTLTPVLERTLEILREHEPATIADLAGLAYRGKKTIGWRLNRLRELGLAQPDREPAKSGTVPVYWRASNGEPPMRREAPSSSDPDRLPAGISVDDGLPAPTRNGHAAKPAGHLDPRTRNLLRDALRTHSLPGLELADFFQGGTR